MLLIIGARRRRFEAAIGGGWLEGVSTGADGWHGYCDEEGKLKGLDMNVAATAIARELGWRVDDVLCGPVIFLGDSGPTGDGEEKDVPDVVLGAARLVGVAYQDATG